MKCMLCPAEFEMPEIETGYRDKDKEAAAVAKQKVHSDEGEKWEHVQVTVTRAGGRVELLAGYLCPAEDLQPGCVQISKTS
jgi:hypothetical protein